MSLSCLKASYGEKLFNMYNSDPKLDKCTFETHSDPLLAMGPWQIT